MDMFKQEDVMMFSEEETSTRQTYDEVVKDLIMDEKQYLRDLHMITKVRHFSGRLAGTGAAVLWHCYCGIPSNMQSLAIRI